MATPGEKAGKLLTGFGAIGAQLSRTITESEDRKKALVVKQRALSLSQLNSIIDRGMKFESASGRKQYFGFFDSQIQKLAEGSGIIENEGDFKTDVFAGPAGPDVAQALTGKFRGTLKEGDMKLIEMVLPADPTAKRLDDTVTFVRKLAGESGAEATFGTDPTQQATIEESRRRFGTTTTFAPGESGKPTLAISAQGERERAELAKTEGNIIETQIQNRFEKFQGQNLTPEIGKQIATEVSGIIQGVRSGRAGTGPAIPAKGTKGTKGTAPDAVIPQAPAPVTGPASTGTVSNFDEFTTEEDIPGQAQTPANAEPKILIGPVGKLDAKDKGFLKTTGTILRNQRAVTDNFLKVIEKGEESGVLRGEITKAAASRSTEGLASLARIGAKVANFFLRGDPQPSPLANAVVAGSQNLGFDIIRLREEGRLATFDAQTGQLLTVDLAAGIQALGSVYMQNQFMTNALEGAVENAKTRNLPQPFIDTLQKRLEESRSETELLRAGVLSLQEKGMKPEAASHIAAKLAPSMKVLAESRAASGASGVPSADEIVDAAPEDAKITARMLLSFKDKDGSFPFWDQVVDAMNSLEGP